MKKTTIFLLGVFLVYITLNHAYSDSIHLNSEKKLEVHFIDAGDGDCILVSLPDSKNLLIDVCGVSSGEKVVNYLKSEGVRHIDNLILTHPHDDHIGGIFSLLSELKVNKFYDNGYNNFRSEVFRDYIQLIRSDPAKYRILKAGETLNIDDAIIEVLNPLLPPTGNLNNNSIVLRLTYGDIKILLTGDIGIPGERRLLNLNTELKSHVLKVGHHGENDSTSEAFLEAVSPEIAIISVSRDNIYARPHDEVLKRLKGVNTKIMRTDLNGHITVKTDGKTYTANSEK